MPRYKSTDPTGVPVSLSDGRVLAAGEIATLKDVAPEDEQHVSAGRLTEIAEPAKTSRAKAEKTQETT